MSTQNKMASDYLWIRHAPIEQGTKFRNFGYHYLYNRAPNRIQRLESIYRSIGKTYDWELQKFRLGRKFVDRGNKRRIFRNFARFLKHPAAYLAWASARWQLASAPRILFCCMTAAWVCALFQWNQYSKKCSQHDEFLMASGKNIEGMSGRYRGYHNSNPVRGPSVFDLWFRVPIQPNMIIVNQTWKQNIRKQLQLTNSQGVVF